MKAAQLRRDFNFVYGEVFEATVRLYEDERQRRRRGTWNQFFTYNPGDGVEWEGTAAGSAVRPGGTVLAAKFPKQAYVALVRSLGVEPGSSGSASFWSKMTTPNLSGSNVEFIVENVFSIKPTVTAEGVVQLSILPSNFATAPSSAPCYLKVTDALGNPTFPVVGTALFRKP